ncbi:MAG: signal peptide peptidase SppA [Planctomycetes bacterium]|nr:signal peptide peptidase SppA [Planctomycetota bacterium]
MTVPPLPPGDDPARPPGVPPQPWPGAAGQPRESRGVAFFVAIFLGILLVASAGLNVLLLLLSIGTFAGAGFGPEADGVFDEVHVAGERGARTKILQVRIHGAIAEAGSPLLGAAGGTVSQVRRALRKAASNEVHGLLLHIDSPGGGVTDSDEIHQLLVRFRREHPDKRIMALFGDMAASGGYYVAAAADRIVARPTSITGSIGVIMSAWNFARAAEQWGIEQVVIKSARTPFKDLLSPTRPMQDEERVMLTGIVDELLDRFVDVVDEGRPNLDRGQVLALATGALYTASQAVANGLVDELGDHETAVAWFRERTGKPVAIVEHRRRIGLGELLFGADAAAPADPVGSLLRTSSGPRFLYYWQGAR